ncbi:MAG TPA: hypothetical protein VFW65_28845 [Pseudonocardiaceae bacterium]|nr:hypothetical protein [Pseudonocardiaceae bacterium]
MTTRLRGIAALLAILAAASACTTHATQRPATPHDHPSPIALRAAIHLLTSDSTSLQQTWYLARAEQFLDQQCMHRAGYRYLTDPGPPPMAGTTTQDVLGTSHPATYGVVWTGPTRLPAEDRYVNSLPTAQRTRYVHTLTGTPGHAATLRLPSGVVVRYQTNGCLGTTRTTLYGSPTAAIEEQTIPQDMRILRDSALNTDPAYLSALRGWRRCMRAAGWNYHSPEAAIQSLQFQATQAISRHHFDVTQAAVASADRACDARNGLRARARHAQAIFLRHQPSKLITTLQTLNLTRTAAYRHALQVLSAHSPQ